MLLLCSDRVQNLYFAYLFVLRAAMKAAPLLTSFDYNTGLPEEDAQTRDLVLRLVGACALLTNSDGTGPWAMCQCLSLTFGSAGLHPLLHGQ